MRNVLGKKLSSAEMQQTLNMQRVKLDQVQAKLSERMEESRKEARECLARGDESGFRVASRRYALSKGTANSINDLREMAGGDLAKIQNQLGLDPTKLESSMVRIRSSMTHMEDIANVLSTTIETSISNPKQLSTDQEILRKELLTEMGAQKSEAEKVKEQVSKELQKT
jgi:hypothetical protein